MSEIRASQLRMIGFSLPALGLNMLVTAVFVFLPALYAEHRGLGAATVGLIFLVAKFIDMGLKRYKYDTGVPGKDMKARVAEKKSERGRKSYSKK